MQDHSNSKKILPTTNTFILRRQWPILALICTTEAPHWRHRFSQNTQNLVREAVFFPRRIVENPHSNFKEKARLAFAGRFRELIFHLLFTESEQSKKSSQTFMKTQNTCQCDVPVNPRSKSQLKHGRNNKSKLLTSKVCTSTFSKRQIGHRRKQIPAALAKMERFQCRWSLKQSSRSPNVDQGKWICRPEKRTSWLVKTQEAAQRFFFTART